MENQSPASRLATEQADRLAKRKRNRSIRLWVWAASYLAPLFLILVPWLGLGVHPDREGRMVQLLVASVLAVWITLFNGLMWVDQRFHQDLFDAIRARGPIGFYDERGSYRSLACKHCGQTRAVHQPGTGCCKVGGMFPGTRFEAQDPGAQALYDGSSGACTRTKA